MATKKVSALTELTSTAGTEELLVNDGGTSKKVTLSNLLYDNSVDSDHYVDGSIDNAHLNDDAVDSDELAAGAVDIAHLSASGTAGSSNFLRGDNSWVTPTDTNTMGSGFTVSATTDSNATTITQGDDLMFTAGTGITCETTADGTVTITNTVSDTNTMGSGFTVSATTDSNATTITQGDDLMFTAGTGITCETTADGTVTITNTVTDTTYSAGSSSALGLIKLEDDATQTTAASAITTTAARTYGLQINASGQGVVNVPWTDTDTTYSVQDGELSQINFTSSDNTKLDGIEASADVTDATNVGSVVNGKQTIWVPATAMNPTESNGCAAIAAVETTSGRPDMQVLDFDKDADEHAQFTVAFPKSWDLGTVTYRVFWSGIASADDVDWMVDAVAMNDNETIDVAYGTAVVVTDNAQGAVEELLVSDESSDVTIAGTPADNDLCYFRIGRDVSGDAMAGDARLHGVKIFFTTDALNDD